MLKTIPFNTDRRLDFGSLKVRSLENKLDSLYEVRRDHSLDILFLVETWHDSDSTCFCRLRADGHQVIDMPRPRVRDDTLSQNHGGVAAISFTGVRRQPVDLGVSPTTFELLCVRVVSGTSSCFVAVIYRPGSAAVSTAFYRELADVLDCLATYNEPVSIVGDLNVRLDRLDDPSSVQLVDVLADRGLSNRVTTPTHNLGGMLDVVVTRDYLPTPSVDVIDIGLSDHHLLQWSVPMSRPPPVYRSVDVRQWRLLDRDAFRAALSSSLLCNSEAWSNNDADDMALVYEREITSILDRMVPVRTVTCRQRPSDPYYDEECRTMKRHVRRFERASSQAHKLVAAATMPTADVVAAAAAADAAWRTERRSYRDLCNRKREAFWRMKVDAEHSTPRQLWQSIDVLMGRGLVPESPAMDACDLHRFFDDKIAAVRAATADAPPPTFTPAPTGCSMSAFRAVSIADVTTAIHKLPDKQCASDPLPTRLLKDTVDLLAPFITTLFNKSLASGMFPAVFKSAYITPRLKKASLDPADVKSYRPISNLPVLSKTLERLVAHQLVEHLNLWSLLPDAQSAYRANHSTVRHCRRTRQGDCRTDAA